MFCSLRKEKNVYLSANVHRNCRKCFKVIQDKYLCVMFNTKISRRLNCRPKIRDTTEHLTTIWKTPTETVHRNKILFRYMCQMIIRRFFMPYRGTWNETSWVGVKYISQNDRTCSSIYSIPNKWMVPHTGTCSALAHTTPWGLEPTRLPYHP